MIDTDERLSRLAGDLVDSGDLSPAWRDTFVSVPRDVFIPDTVWRETADGLVPVRRADDPAGWLDLAYADAFVVTQVDDGRPAGPGGTGRQMTSSASRPGVVALMLEALRVEPGMSVCEIGTGTGYNAALLSARLGADYVTSVEIDPEVTEAARRALASVGYAPTVVCGDGARGYEPNAPYDRVIATAAVNQVPYAWVAQTRPGGLVLTPWATEYHNGALLALDVDESGAAVGRFVGNVAFMWLREQRGGLASVEDDVYDVGSADRSRTGLHPYYVVGDYAASLAIGIQVPGCKNIVVHGEDGAYTVWFIDQGSRSWASIEYAPGAETFPVRQLGSRRLWDEIEAAYGWWEAAGSPGPERWRITVTSKAQRIELAR